MKKNYKRKILFTSLIGACFIMALQFLIPSCTQPIDASSYTKNPNDIVHVTKAERLQKIIVKLPDNYDANKTYPVLFALHGNGGDAQSMANMFNAYTSMEVIFVFPQGQYTKALGGYSWYLETSNKAIWEMGDLFSADNIIEAMNEVKNYYKISNAFIFGFSQGASVAYMAGLKYSSKIKGIAAVGGILPEIDVAGSVIKTADINNAVNLKILIARGAIDSTVPKENSDFQKEFFNTKGFDVVNFEYAGGHEITTALLQKIFIWMNEKSR